MINNSVMKCCICNNEKIGEFITINDKKYHLCCIEDLQKKAEHQKQMIKSQYGTIKSINKTSQNRKDAIKSLLVQNEKLKKKAELGEHYKHLYSEVKKQKDDVVEYIKHKMSIKENYMIYGDIGTELLRMLGEIDE